MGSRRSGFLAKRRKREDIALSSFFTLEEIRDLGFRGIGDNVLISRRASIYSPQNMSLGSNIRIDDFCILTGSITLGSNIHIAPGSYLLSWGGYPIIMEDFTGIAPRGVIVTSTHDYQSSSLFGPMVPEEYKKTRGGPVIFREGSLIGSGTIVLPNVTLGEGTSVGALSLVNKDLSPHSCYAGIPCKMISSKQ